MSAFTTLDPDGPTISVGGASRATSVSSVVDRENPVWRGLSRADVEELRGIRPSESLGQMFAGDPGRADRFTLRCAGLVVDLSRNLWDERVREALLGLARRAAVDEGFRRLAAGERLNTSEDRPVGHVALRSSRRADVGVDGASVRDEVEATLDSMAAFVHAVAFGDIRGSTGRCFTDVVNIGIGGSDLGPAMAHEALRAFRVTGLRCRFVANLDVADLESNLVDLDPETTLVVVASKTFTTLETMANAEIARAWLSEALGGDGAIGHLVAVTADPRAADRFGVGRVFPFREWVGGRYSVGSSIGLSLMLAVGPAHFRDFLDGMAEVDDHVLSASLEHNAPLLVALLGVWYRDVLGLSSKAVLPYSHDLRRLPAYLQQLDMESNGKSTRIDGSTVDVETGPVVWGEPGTNAQHAFFQLLHQGTSVVPVDLLGFARAGSTSAAMFANLLAQANVLAFGRPADLVPDDPRRPHRVFPGNRPSTLILAERLDPRTLGRIIAFYEHVVFFQGLVWGINSFDQWGVELGKEVARGLLPLLGEPAGRSGPVGVDETAPLDTSSLRAIEWFRAHSADAPVRDVPSGDSGRLS